MIHSVEPERRGWPSLPFAAVVEASVVRALRQAGLSMAKIRDAVAGIRADRHDEYGLVRPTIGHDVAEIFISEGPNLYRARDRQQVITDTVNDFRRILIWEGNEPTQIRLQQFGGEVVLDPRFGWGWAAGYPWMIRSTSAGLISDHYTDDAQDIGDQEWLALAAELGCAVLTKDQMICRRHWSKQVTHPVFCLS